MLGQSIGNYRIIRKLGEGGMGVVYLAEHPRIGRKVAIKTIHPGRPITSERVERFANEAWAANNIRHPNIVEIYDFGTLPDGRVYLIMEYLEGESLDQRLTRVGHLTEAEALPVVCQVARALVAVHAKGIVHRDLKPQNMFLVGAPAGGPETVKLLDFGIAKLDAQPWESPITTHSGVLMGTPLYASPEQLKRPKTVDHRSDIYALGVMLYEMVCGQPPFRAEGLADLIDQHLNQAPLPPRQHVPELSSRLEEVILACLAKDRDCRVQSMRELLVRLHGAGNDGVPEAAAAEVAGRCPSPLPIIPARGQTLDGGEDVPAPSRSHLSTLSPVSGARTRKSARGRVWAVALTAVLLTASLAVALAVRLAQRRESAVTPRATGIRVDVAGLASAPTPDAGPPAPPTAPASIAPDAGAVQQPGREAFRGKRRASARTSVPAVPAQAAPPQSRPSPEGILDERR